MYKPIRSSSSSFANGFASSLNSQSTKSRIQRIIQSGWEWTVGPGKNFAITLIRQTARRIRMNLSARRIVSFPHLLVLFWIVILLWGERWVFESKVKHCAWEKWEKWPRGATPHHLILVADPQITDHHSYPGRQWLLNTLTILVTDNYLRRGYGALQGQLRPDSVFFLGDLFDGGREWKPRLGTFVDPMLGLPRHDDEQAWVETWHEKYGQEYWLEEYERYGHIFFDQWNKGGDAPGAYQRGRKFVTSLPGNHDLGFGSQVQVSVRNRFSSYFGELNRVDVVGNHTIVSVDGPSLSADTSRYADGNDLTPIYGPVNQFLNEVQALKRKAVTRELEVWHGKSQDLRYGHVVEELDQSDLSKFPQVKTAGKGPELPTILLSHIPLYRNPGTPCGELREHWPPVKRPKGQVELEEPDMGNAIAVQAGYQYQNVLNEEDSVKLIKSIGNVKQVFSGDDHDYCELVHSTAKENVREITVKSLSMVMSVRDPGFLMVSLYNPVDANGESLAGPSEPTLQTHLCLLPNQLRIYMRYLFFGLVTVALLMIRAYLVPLWNLTPFALPPTAATSSSSSSSPSNGILPTHKDKVDPPDAQSLASVTSGTSSTNFPSRMRSNSTLTSNGRWAAKHLDGHAGGRKGWGIGRSLNKVPRIDLDSHSFYDSHERGWKAGSGRMVLGVAVRELWCTLWRCVWMILLLWAYINRNG